MTEKGNSNRTVTAPPGTFAENIIHFGRTLRRAGLPVGPGKVLEAIKAVECAGLERRDDFYWTLHSIFVNRHDQWALFDQAFHIFWKNPDILKKMMDMMLPTTFLDQVNSDADEISKRLSQALAPDEAPSSDTETEKEEIEINAELTTSSNELLQTKDFEDMSVEEAEEAKKAIKSLKLPIRDVKTRRLKLPDVKNVLICAGHFVHRSALAELNSAEIQGAREKASPTCYSV